MNVLFSLPGKVKNSSQFLTKYRVTDIIFSIFSNFYLIAFHLKYFFPQIQIHEFFIVVLSSVKIISNELFYLRHAIFEFYEILNSIIPFHQHNYVLLNSIYKNSINIPCENLYCLLLLFTFVILSPYAF